MTGGVAGFIQHALSRRTGRLGRAVHPRGVEVALEGESVTKRSTVGAQVVPPVKGQCIDVERADGLMKVAAAFISRACYLKRVFAQIQFVDRAGLSL